MKNYYVYRINLRKGFLDNKLFPNEYLVFKEGFSVYWTMWRDSITYSTIVEACSMARNYGGQVGSLRANDPILNML